MENAFKNVLTVQYQLKVIKIWTTKNIKKRQKVLS